MISKRYTAPAFYFGTLVSSIGSMALTVGLIAFMLKNDFAFWQVGFIIGISRFIPVVISVFVGHKIDALPARPTIFWSEVGAAIASILLLIAWVYLDKNYPLMVIAMTLRAVFTSLQIGSRVRIAKMLGDSSYQSNSVNAAWLNKVTQGATLFGGILSWLAIEHSSLSNVIVFDTVTFLLNGLILFFLPLAATATVELGKVPILKKFKDLYHYNTRAAILDFCLIFSMMGTSAITARLAEGKENWFPLLVICYGLSVWVAGFLERNKFVQKLSVTLWIILGISQVILGTFSEPNFGMWMVSFVRDTTYWILFHRISAHVTHGTPNEVTGSVAFARNAQMVTIFALGEIIVGSWKTVMPLSVEFGWRGVLCLIVALMLNFKFKRVEQYEKAHL